MSKLVSLRFKDYKKIKFRIKNIYLRSAANDENMNYIYTLAKLLRISDTSFIKSMSSFVGLPHRHEIFLKKGGITFINDSKATSFQSSRFALASSKNIYWIVGGLPKEKDKIDFKNIKNNITKSYIIGKNISFFKKQLNNKVKFTIKKTLRKAIISALKDMKQSDETNKVILLSPGAASFDQFENFESRGNEFKKLSKLYAKKFI